MRENIPTPSSVKIRAVEGENFLIPNFGFAKALEWDGKSLSVDGESLTLDYFQYPPNEEATPDNSKIVFESSKGYRVEIPVGYLEKMLGIKIPIPINQE